MPDTAVDIPGYVVGRWSIDAVHSHVGFVIRHLMVSKIRGSFTKFEGEIVTAENPLESTVTATIDLTAIETSNDQRDAHLRSADFFEVDKHPTMTFVSTGVRRDGDRFVLDGDLTIKGVTKAVPLALEVNGFGPDGQGGTKAGFSATGEIDRTDFAVSYNGPIPGGGLALGEKVQIILDIEADLQS